ncbi:MAG: hypothetical protein V1790_00990 [Planctomycetota bacterium]
MRRNSTLILLMGQGLMPYLTACDSAINSVPQQGSSGPRGSEGLWFEGWENAIPGTYVPSFCSFEPDCTSINGDMGSWLVRDTVSPWWGIPQDEGGSGCGDIPHSAEIMTQEANRRLKLIAQEGSCPNDIWVELADGGLSLPLHSNTYISFFEDGELDNPTSGEQNSPCGLMHAGCSIIYVRLQDGEGNQLVYLLEAAPGYSPFSLPMYREVLLASEGAFHERNLFDDFSEIAWFEADEARIEHIEFGLTQRGWAIIDDITITRRQ